MTSEEFYIAKLFVGDGHNAYMPQFGQDALDALDMYIGIFAAVAVPQVHTELEHGETILHDFFTESGCHLPFLGGFCRKVIEYNDPQKSILI